MEFLIIAWAMVVTHLTTTTKIYQDCKDVKCEVKVKEIGYEIVKEPKHENN